MRTLSVAPPENREVAYNLLKSLQGYNFRQARTEADITYLVSVLDTWDKQVADLEQAVAGQRDRILNQIEQIQSLQSENDELRATTGLKGVMVYLKSKAGLI